ncbi:MAG: DUF4234 domain-containing protein [Synergistaceae bacterium]|nr:DUF4234 domain-containing protein [Synergistaceae bacterium]MBR0220593.1 DUF4234 domain-containing protein [Synergistaceae bacterium]
MPVDLDEKTLTENENLKREAEYRKKLNNLVKIKYASTAFVLFLSVFTIGLYSIYWYGTRSGDLNKLNPECQLPAWGAGVYLASWIYMMFIQSDDVQPIIMLASSIFYWWLAFRVRKILRLYASKNISGSVVARYIAPSAVWTFLFGSIYLQSQINKMIQMEILAPKV